MARNRSSYTLLYRYISKEFAQNFAVSFSFFFCIFFINSILLLVQRILLRNIDIGTMLEIVSLSMPQFLIYTFPFASLSASSMVLGDLGSTNELLAMRSSGIPSSKVYQPLIIISLLLSLVTFFFADAVLPWSSVKYQEKLNEIMRDMPTFEIQPNSVNTIGSIVLSNGESAGNQIDDILLLSNDPSIHQNRIVTSPRGTLTLVDDDSYIYSLELEAPEMLITDPSDREMYGFTHADKAIFYLDFSSQIPALTSNAPMNLSSRDLISGIMERAERTREDGLTVVSICTPDLGITKKAYTTPQPSQVIEKKVVVDGDWELAAPADNVRLAKDSGKTAITASCVDGQPVEFTLKRL